MTQPNLTVGAKLYVIWGKYGYIPTVIATISKKSGNIYVRRWIMKRKMYSTPRLIEWRNGQYHVI